MLLLHKDVLSEDIPVIVSSISMVTHESSPPPSTPQNMEGVLSEDALVIVSSTSMVTHESSHLPPPHKTWRVCSLRIYLIHVVSFTSSSKSAWQGIWPNMWGKSGDSFFDPLFRNKYHGEKVVFFFCIHSVSNNVIFHLPIPLGFQQQCVVSPGEPCPQQY